jgi:hypothetical protein
MPRSPILVFALALKARAISPHAASSTSAASRGRWSTGTLRRIDLVENIREGAHYTQFIV